MKPDYVFRSEGWDEVRGLGSVAIVENQVDFERSAPPYGGKTARIDGKDYTVIATEPYSRASVVKKGWPIGLLVEPLTQLGDKPLKQRETGAE